MQIVLPAASGQLENYRLTGDPIGGAPMGAKFNRIAYSAAHVVADPLRSSELNQPAVLDWTRTIEYRRYLIGQGLGIAEAMDTAQRGMGVTWDTARELVERTMQETRDLPGALIASGCGTDHLPAHEATSCDDVIRAYALQLDAIQRTGSRVILMASRALVRVARHRDDFLRVYREVLAMCSRPVILHWLGDMFDPELKGYWGSNDLDAAADVCLQVIADNAHKVDGIKISLLDDAREIAFRRRLPQGVKMYTGDDFNYPSLIKGDEQGYSHALLGIFDAIAPAASQALAALAAGDAARYDRLLEPTVALSRHIFRAPTQYYKTGVVFLAYLNGFQPHFFMPGGHHGARPPLYLADVFRLADAANLLREPELAVQRMRLVMQTFGL
ncbi:dihydrodipicolinate synthase family protein [Caballeronia sp. LZ043]|uniref:dihydrodipicolinate synthase family protein n=1 Tax=Caballeronia sp. LZ043 TaxID=3038569 RepID=UPI00285A5728|nr:dihydrodipicolinate synthase family protein [Caballeronia sp. LZ043]MDR5825679.1 dihydrodipicolinate synthase family protein [Caballeronia sp. LZ043]